MAHNAVKVSGKGQDLTEGVNTVDRVVARCPVAVIDNQRVRAPPGFFLFFQRIRILGPAVREVAGISQCKRPGPDC